MKMNINLQIETENEKEGFQALWEKVHKIKSKDFEICSMNAFDSKFMAARVEGQSIIPLCIFDAESESQARELLEFFLSTDRPDKIESQFPADHFHIFPITNLEIYSK